MTALIESDRRLLLERRADAPLWGLVGGGVEDDETLEDALRREVREETGLEIERLALFGTFSDPSRIARYPDGSVVQLVTVAYVVVPADESALCVGSESVELRFFALADLPVGELVPIHRPLLERYASGRTPPFLD